MILDGSFHTKIVGVTFKNDDGSDRQRIIRNLIRNGELDEGAELFFVPQPTNPYDSNCILVNAGNGQTLGTLSREMAADIAPQIRQGYIFKVFVASQTGGDIGYSYGLNLKVDRYKPEIVPTNKDEQMDNHQKDIFNNHEFNKEEKNIGSENGNKRVNNRLVVGNPEEWMVLGITSPEIHKCLLPTYKQWDLVIPSIINNKTIVGISSGVFCKNTFSLKGSYDDPDVEEEFIDNEDIHEVTVSEGITYIGTGAFKCCSKLKKVHLPEGLLKLGKECFSGCSNLEEINLPNTLTEIGYDCFAWCKKISSIVIPVSLQNMRGAFSYGCKIKTIIFSEGITSLENFTFTGAEIDSMVIPRSISRIGEHMALPDASSEVTLFCYPDTFGLTYARMNGYHVEIAEK